MSENGVKVSFIIVARNAAKYLDNLLLDYANQKYPLQQCELLIIDGNSTDATIEIANQFKKKNPDLSIAVHNNPGQILSSGWNIALSNAKGDIILRVDAHARMPEDFIMNNVAQIEAGEKICGGHLVTIPPTSEWGNLLYASEHSRFGGGAADFRNAGKARVVDSVAYAAYHRSVFATVGGYDERLVRNQDNEIHYRMHKAGFRFYYNPEIKSYYQMRDSLTGLIKQKFNNGIWVGLTLGVQPKCFRPRHLIPGLFVLFLALSSILNVVPIERTFSPIALPLISLLYFGSALGFSLKAAIESEKSLGWRFMALPFIFFFMHFAYGMGTWVGLLRMPFFIWRNRQYTLPWPIVAGR